MSEKNIHNDYYIYRHLKPCGEVFYIGRGRGDRAYQKIGRRNLLWERVVAKHGYEIQIIKTGLTFEESNEIEIMLIKHYGRRDLGTGCLVNMTDGGGGSLGTKQSPELIAKRTAHKKGVPTNRKDTPKQTERKRKQFIKMNSDPEFINRRKRILKEMGYTTSIKVINTVTGEIYFCIKEAARVNNIDYSFLAKKLKGQKINNTPFMYLHEYLKIKEND